MREYTPFVGAIVGSVLCFIVGGIGLLLFLPFDWPPDFEWQTRFEKFLYILAQVSYRAFYIAAVGAILGAFLGSHAGHCAKYPTRAWGIISGGLVGLMFGWIPGVFIAVTFGFSATSLYLGILVLVLSGVVCWQAGYQWCHYEARS